MRMKQIFAAGALLLALTPNFAAAQDYYTLPEIREQAEQQIELAARELNLQLVKYSKSGYFTVVEEEVPKVAKTFSADEFIKRMGVKEE